MYIWGIFNDVQQFCLIEKTLLIFRLFVYGGIFYVFPSFVW